MPPPILPAAAPVVPPEPGPPPPPQPLTFTVYAYEVDENRLKEPDYKPELKGTYQVTYDVRLVVREQRAIDAVRQHLHRECSVNHRPDKSVSATYRILLRK